MTDSIYDLIDRYPVTMDEDGVGWLKGEVHHIWFQPRPAYCDRGHFIAHVEPAPGAGYNYSVDDSDQWPRYYMDYGDMLNELRRWLGWRESDGPKQQGDAVFSDRKQQSITCPRCHRTSYNPNDIRTGYCGGCHEFTRPGWERGYPIDGSIPCGGPWHFESHSYDSTCPSCNNGYSDNTQKYKSPGLVGTPSGWSNRWR